MGKSADTLQKVDLSVVTNAECSGKYQVTRKLPKGIIETQMCLGGSGGKDTCQGDSGGPAQIREKLEVKEHSTNLYTLMGITSFGESCATATPGVYTRISSYISWIESIVWPTTL